MAVVAAFFDAMPPDAAAAAAAAPPSEESQRLPPARPAAAVIPHLPDTKYFHEPGGDMDLGHYDKRYFRGKVTYEERGPALRHLIRSYLATLRSLGVETWLAHGSLLGWWWNGRIMPWDYDLDVQVTVASLAYLGASYNRTLFSYNYTVPTEVGGDEDDDDEEEEDDDDDVNEAGGDCNEDGSSNGRSSQASKDQAGTTPRRKKKKEKKTQQQHGQQSSQEKQQHHPPGGTPPTTHVKKYLLDVNPHYGARTRGNGQNIIDARWIDVSTGLFIDITGLAEREPGKNPGVWSCKNKHEYRRADLYPMRRTEFEGVEATVPHAFDRILTEEYGAKSLTATRWAGHQWDAERREWVKSSEEPAKEPAKEAVKKVVVVVQVPATDNADDKAKK